MNAAEQATDLHLASKIASVVHLFKQHFPDARADLKPWSNDSETRSTLDPDSLDVGFHFPGWSPRIESRTMLVQMRFLGNAVDDVAVDDVLDRELDKAIPEATKYPPSRLIGLDVVGLTYEGEQWRLSTIADWGIVGRKSPAMDTTKKLKDFCRQVFELFQTNMND